GPQHAGLRRALRDLPADQPDDRGRSALRLPLQPLEHQRLRRPRAGLPGAWRPGDPLRGNLARSLTQAPGPRDGGPGSSGRGSSSASRMEPEPVGASCAPTTPISSTAAGRRSRRPRPRLFPGPTSRASLGPLHPPKEEPLSLRYLLQRLSTLLLVLF